MAVIASQRVGPRNLFIEGRPFLGIVKTASSTVETEKRYQVMVYTSMSFNMPFTAMGSIAQKSAVRSDNPSPKCQRPVVVCIFIQDRPCFVYSSLYRSLIALFLNFPTLVFGISSTNFTSSGSCHLANFLLR